VKSRHCWKTSRLGKNLSRAATLIKISHLGKSMP
jgi:hypothetical protein